MTYTNQRGFTPTEDQQARICALSPALVYGPTFDRSVRDSLASLAYAWDAREAEYWLLQAEGHNVAEAGKLSDQRHP